MKRMDKVNFSQVYFLEIFLTFPTKLKMLRGVNEEDGQGELQSGLLSRDIPHFPHKTENVTRGA
jgi:hypothetical protein